MLDDDMQRLVDATRLGFVATVSPDGSPNVSPKGTTAVWDDHHLVFATSTRTAPWPTSSTATVRWR